MSKCMQMLVAKDGQLYADDSPLLIIYPEGDCDRFKYPADDVENKDEWAGKLAHALYDANEMGLVNLVDGKIMLPNGTEFDVGANTDKWSPPSMEGIWF